MEDLAALVRLSDKELVAALKRAVRNERESCAEVIAHLVEFDRRRLHAPEGYPSLFHYCTRELGYAEEAAYKRIRAARAAASFPRIIRLLRSGRIHLGAVVALSAHLTPENHRELLERACGLSARELEFLVAGLAPRPDKADCVRRLAPAAPDRTPIAEPGLFAPDKPDAPAATHPHVTTAPSVSAAPAETHRHPPPASERLRRDLAEALSADRVRIAFTASRKLWERLERARSILRFRYPDGRLEGVFADALEALLERIDPDLRSLARKRRQHEEPGNSAAAGSRRVPQRVRDEVWRRDGGRCTFLAPSGARCEARSGLELDHVRPWSLGGRSDAPVNLRLMCRAHNLLLARQVFGELAAVRGQRR